MVVPRLESGNKTVSIVHKHPGVGGGTVISSAANVSVTQKREEWDAWFSDLHEWDPSSTEIVTNRTKHNILYYHVKKTGGSTLFDFFDEVNRHNGVPDNPGKKPNGHGYGIERPGLLSRFILWRTEDSVEENRLLAISFREPVERVISHYFQLKPCPDGTGGGAHEQCRASAKRSFSMYLSSCQYASNFQSMYLDGNFSQVDAFDFLILNDRSEESLVLASIRFNIPIRDMLHVNNQKVRVGSGELLQEEQKSNSLSCTAQWMKQLIPPDKLKEVEACVHSCAGKIGRLIFSKEELEGIETRNMQDIELWRNHVLPKYNSEKAKVFEKYGVTQEDLDKVVEGYRDAMARYKVHEEHVTSRVEMGHRHLVRRELLEVAEWLQ